MMSHSPSTDEAVLLFVTTYTVYFWSLEDWQRLRVLCILKHALDHPGSMPKKQSGLKCLKPLYEFAEACIAIWKSSCSAKPIPPPQELLHSIPKQEHVVIPTEEQFESMMEDLSRLAAERMALHCPY